METVVRECRVCLDENPESMISPCKCKGTREWICEECFLRLMSHSWGNCCAICNSRYTYEMVTEWQYLNIFWEQFEKIHFIALLINTVLIGTLLMCRHGGLLEMIIVVIWHLTICCVIASIKSYNHITRIRCGE